MSLLLDMMRSVAWPRFVNWGYLMGGTSQKSSDAESSCRAKSKTRKQRNWERGPAISSEN